MSNATAYVVPVFAPRYEATVPADRIAYVRDELKRLFADGGAILLAVLSPRVAIEAQVIALEMLRTNRDNFRFAGGGSSAGPFGAQLVRPGHVWRLRLKPGAVPPPIDPQGRRLPPEKAGKVLVAKTGLLEGDDGAERSTSSGEWTGPARAIRAATSQDIMQTVEVTRDGDAYEFRDAVCVLRKWGIGCTLKQYTKPRNWKAGEYVDPDSPAGRGQDCWLVEELTPAMLAELDAKASKKAAG